MKNKINLIIVCGLFSKEVNSENFLNILKGNKTAMISIGTGRVIER